MKNLKGMAKQRTENIKLICCQLSPKVTGINNELIDDKPKKTGRITIALTLMLLLK